jgi:hypothetical protein
MENKQKIDQFCAALKITFDTQPNHLISPVLNFWNGLEKS